MGSKSLLKTNVSLTTNIKLVVTSDYKLYLESIDSHPQLSATRYKHFLINKDVYIDEVFPLFFKDTSVDIAFSILETNDKDKVGKDYNDQYDFTYNAGSNYISDTFYKEEFEYFAPLYIDGDLPKNFIIFRVDGPGLINLTKENFRTEILDKWKCVTYFDLDKSILGEFLEKNITDNDIFPKTSLEIDVRKNEFSKWNGINYETGGFSSKSLFIEDFLENENTYFDFDKFITDGWKNNKVIFPHILNMNFLFDDTPANKDRLRKWSINRYLGFYIQNKYTSIKVTPYEADELISNIKIISDNIIVNNSNQSVDPIKKTWKKDFYWIEYLGDFYKLTRYKSNDAYVYKIISDLDLSGKESYINKQMILVDSDNYLKYNSKYNTNIFDIPDFDNWDLCLIDINNKWHVVKKDTTGFKIQSDYTFEITHDTLTYYINKSDSSYTTVINLQDIDITDRPINFDIFFCNFSDVMDIDNNIIDTRYAEYEYSKSDIVSVSGESKLYKEDFNSDTIPFEIDTYIYNNEYVNIPVTSEYISTSELFEVNKNELTKLWNKNPIFTKWGYNNSISTYDYVYKLNNSFKSEDFNRDVNTNLILPNRFERNLDYFYNINSSPINSSVDYDFQSLGINILDSNKNIQPYLFDKTLYYGSSTDYFKYLFSKSDYLDNGDTYYNTRKYSTFNLGTKDITNSTVFRGIKFNMYDVKKVFTDSGKLSSFSLKPTNTFDNYDFSILLTKSTNETNRWLIVDHFELNRYYNSGDAVIYNDIIYIANTSSIVTDPNYDPELDPSWSYTTDDDILYNPSTIYATNSYIYYDNDFWISKNGLSNTIPGTSSNIWVSSYNYAYEDCVLYKHNIYISKTSSNLNYQPTDSTYWMKLSQHNTYTTYNIGDYVSNGTDIYKATSQNTNSTPPSADWSQVCQLKWSLIEYWSQNELLYTINDYVQQNSALYKKINSTSNGSLTNPSIWSKIYDINPQQGYIYGYYKSTNNIIFMNNRYYKYYSTNNSTLDNGITIHINKKWKNILVEIYINDVTIPNISESERDLLYKDINMKLTAKNFMDCINDVSNNYGFVNNIKYNIINEDLTRNEYTILNITDIPYLLTCQAPDIFKTKFNSYRVHPVSIDSSIYKVNNILKDRIIPTINEKDYYDGSKLGVEIVKNNNENLKTIESFSGLKNINFVNMYRFNGFYSPILYKVDLFKSVDLINDGITNKKFDELLTDFGLYKQLIYSKINTIDTPLRLKNFKNVKSIYPMIDEYGYSYKDFFLFKSNWDFDYYTSVKKM